MPLLIVALSYSRSELRLRECLQLGWGGAGAAAVVAVAEDALDEVIA